MKVFLTILVLLFATPTDAFGQKCKEPLPKDAVFTNKGGAKITRKPQPQYTEEARKHQITGTVLLRGLFHSSGQVKNVCWLSSLPYGLTENAIKAAYQIIFEPLKKDGRPVSTSMVIEYNFNLY